MPAVRELDKQDNNANVVWQQQGHLLTWLRTEVAREAANRAAERARARAQQVILARVLERNCMCVIYFCTTYDGYTYTKL
jgi:hypothetical protein